MRTKQLLTAFFLLAMPVLAGAQIVNPIKWAFTSKKINAQTWELHITATIQSGWRIYAQEAGEGPVPTTFRFSQNPLVATTGKVKESGKLHKALDKNFSAELKYYEKQVTFVQTVTIKGTTATQVKGSVEYMPGSNDECLPPQKMEFSIKVGGK